MLTDYRIRQRDHLLEIVRALTQRLDLDAVLTRILRAAADMLQAQAGLIALREEETPRSRFGLRAHYRVSPEFIRLFETILSDAPDTGSDDPTSYFIGELERRLHIVARVGGFDLAGTVGLPLETRGQLIGILLVFRATTAPYARNERQILQAFADHAAIAVTNARLYEQVSQEKQQLDAILEGSADGILIMDSGHHVQRWNRSLARLTGISSSQAIGSSHDDLIRWKLREPGPDLADAEARGWPFGQDAPLYVEGDLMRRDGPPVAVGVTYAPIFDRQHRLAHMVANIRDITRFREAEELKSTFISVISHELKTPVSLIKGYAGTLRRTDASWDSETLQDSLEIIEEEADRLTNLIENLLDASRLQAGGLELNMGNVRLGELAARLASKFQTQIDTHTLVVNFPDELPLIRGDEERLTQVFSNLVSNAIKYSPEGSTITISGRTLPREVNVTVTDMGPGLPAEEKERVFERFYRPDTDTSRAAQGAGLGLFISRAIIEAHGGQIWVESDPGQGSTFHCTLPR